MRLMHDQNSDTSPSSRSVCVIYSFVAVGLVVQTRTFRFGGLV